MQRGRAVRRRGVDVHPGVGQQRLEQRRPAVADRGVEGGAGGPRRVADSDPPGWTDTLPGGKSGE